MKIKIEIEIDTDNKKDCLMMKDLRNIIEEYDKEDDEDEGYEFDD